MSVAERIRVDERPMDYRVESQELEGATARARLAWAVDTFGREVLPLVRKSRENSVA